MLARRLWVFFENLERQSLWLVAVFTFIYFAAIWTLASIKQFWNDELFTFYISRLSSMSAIWDVLLTGAEQIPPVFFVITRAFTAFFGQSYLAFRLSETLGYWIMMLSLYLFVRRRSSPAYGLLAMVFPLVTEGLYYGSEARPYGLILGFAGLALLFWQSTAGGPRRGPALIGLSASLAGALACHYYAVLVFVPLGIGETVRLFNRKRLDLPVAVAIAAGLIPLILFLPLIRAAHTYSATFWAKPQWTNILGFYYYLLYPATFVLICIPMILVIGSAIDTPETIIRPQNSRRIPSCEVAAAIGFSCLPLIAVLLAKTITGAFTNRYAIPAVIGISVLLAWSAFLTAGNRTAPGMVISLLAVGIFCLTAVKSYRDLKGSARNAERVLRYLHDKSQGGSPVVVGDPHLFFQLSSLAGERGAPWLIYLADRDLALHYTGTDTVELGLLNFQHWAPLRIEDFRRYSGSRQEFLIYGYGAPYAWIAQELTREGWNLTVKDMETGQLLLFANRPNHQLTGATESTARSARE